MSVFERTVEAWEAWVEVPGSESKLAGRTREEEVVWVTCRDQGCKPG